MGFRWRAAAAAVALTCGAGCWGQPGGGPGNTFYNPFESGLTIDNVATLRQVWTGRGGLSAVMNGKVLGADWSGTGVDVVAHDLRSGAEAWSRTLTPPGVVSSAATHPPVVVGRDVWVGYQARTAENTCVFGLTRLDLASGSLVGTDTTGAPTELVPFADKVAVATRTYAPFPGDTCSPSLGVNQFVADGTTGATDWAADFHATDKITVVGDRLFAVGGNSLSSYATSGCGSDICAPAWTTQPAGSGALYGLAGESASTLVAVAPNGPGQVDLHAIDGGTGRSLGSIRLGFVGTPLALADGTVYATGGTTLAAFDVASCAAGACEMTWAATLGGTASGMNALAVAGGVVYVGRLDGGVEAFAAAGCGAATCAAVGSVSISDSVTQLAVSQGHLVVGSFDSVTAFAAV